MIFEEVPLKGYNQWADFSRRRIIVGKTSDDLASNFTLTAQLTVSETSSEDRQKAYPTMIRRLEKSGHFCPDEHKKIS